MEISKGEWINGVIINRLNAVADSDEIHSITVSVDVMQHLRGMVTATAGGDHFGSSLNIPATLQYWTVNGPVQIKVNPTWPEECIQGKTKAQYEADKFFDELLSN